MRAKPWPLVILAVLHFLGPLFNTLGGALLMKVSYGQYLAQLFATGSWWELSVTFLLYPLAGYAIWAVKEWSYPVYLALMTIVFGMNFYEWWRFSNVFTAPVLLGTLVVNIGLVSYFLLPAVRAAYFNKRLRWWESKPRFEVHVPAVLEAGERELRVTIADISEGGAFISSASKLGENQKVRIHFALFSRPVSFRGQVVYRRWKGLRGYGVQFEHTDESRRQLVRLIKGLRLIGLTKREAGNSKESFQDWLQGLLKSGEGLIPEVPVLPKQAAKTDKVRKRSRKRDKMKMQASADGDRHAA